MLSPSDMDDIWRELRAANHLVPFEPPTFATPTQAPSYLPPPVLKPELVGIWSKIEWAKKHFEELKVARRRFRDTKPYKFSTKRDPNSRKLTFYVSHVEPVPMDIVHLTADAIAGLVAVLDHLAFQLFKRFSPNEAGDRVQFPISRGSGPRTKHESDCKGKVKGIEPTVVVPELLSLEAYKGGAGHDLWVLNELNNLAKHRHLMAAGGEFGGTNLGPYMSSQIAKDLGIPDPGLNFWVKPSDRLCPLKVGDELLIHSSDDEANPNVQFLFDIAINEPEIIKSQPLVETVHQLGNLVETIVGRFAKYL